MIKPLNKLANELEDSLDKLNKVTYILTPKVCPQCHKLIVDQDELIAMWSLGTCLSCDHLEGGKWA